MFHDLLKLVPWSVFDTLVKKHGSDQQLRGFDTRHQFIALLYGQFSGAESLRAIETAMTSHEARLYRVGGKAPRRSTFADASRYRGPRVFSGLFEHMPGMANRKMRQEMKEVARLIDSTSLHPAGVGAQWARFSEDVCGAKAHVIHDPDLGRPVYHSVAAANVNDITAAKETPIDAGASGAGVPLSCDKYLAAHAATAEPRGRPHMGPDAQNRRRMAPETPNPSSPAKSPLRRQTPKAGAVCGNTARTDLCGGAQK